MVGHIKKKYIQTKQASRQSGKKFQKMFKINSFRYKSPLLITVIFVLADKTGKTYAFFLKTRKSVSLSGQNRIFTINSMTIKM